MSVSLFPFSKYSRGAVTALSVSCCVLMMASGSALAGFDAVGSGGAQAQNLPHYVISTQPQNNLSDSVQSKNVRSVQMSQPVGKSPAFQEFNERYAPQSVKEKYGLGDDWYGKTKTVGVIADQNPVPLVPETMGTDLPVRAHAKPLALVESWRGRKGEAVQDVLRRWSQRSGADLMWASPENPPLKEDFSFVGNFQDAVAALMRSGGMGQLSSQFRPEGLNPVMMSPASMVEAHTALPDQPKEEPNAFNAAMSHVFTPKAPEKTLETRWFGLSGASLSEVLAVWGEDAGVQVIWQADKNFALKDTVTQVGQFEDAVFQALSQYDNDVERPIGEMFRDPQSGQKVLVIRTDVPS